MAELKDETQILIVVRLACFCSITEIIEELKEYKVTATRQQVAYYDPTNATSKNLAEKWRELFVTTREKFISDISDIGVAHQAYRLRRLQRMIDNPSNAKNPVLVASLMEQAAKETGGMYTNKRELSGPGGKPIEINASVMDEAGKELAAWRAEQAKSIPDLSKPPSE